MTRTSARSGSPFEAAIGFSRAVRVGNLIRVSGTTATHGPGRQVAPGDPAAQTTFILDKIAAALVSLGARMEDVVQTRVYLADAHQWEPVSRAHGRVFGGTLPANTLIQAGQLIGDYQVEIEAEAIVSG